MAKAAEIKLEVLRGGVTAPDEDGALKVYGKGSVITAPTDYKHLVSGKDPICKVYEPPKESPPAEL